MAPRTLRLGLSAKAPVTPLAALATILLALAATGCSTAVARRSVTPVNGNQGGSWDLVLAGPLAADAGAGPEFTRRDAALQWDPSESPVTRDLASPYGPPTLARARRLNVPRDPYSYIFYQGRPGRR